MNNSQNPKSKDEEQSLLLQRRQKLAALRLDAGNGKVPYPNDFRRDATSRSLHADYGDLNNAQLEQKQTKHTIAGRVMRRRIMGKAAFITLRDYSGDFQAYVRSDLIGAETYKQFLEWDLGDIIGVGGKVFRTKTGELSIEANRLRLLAKNLRPLPDKHKGLTDKELRHRRRYLDLLMNPASADLFRTRSRIIAFIRDFFEQKGFLEMETPMLHSLPGGANARPFETYHNALSMPLFLRIAPELFLKKLVVGGFEKVFEINRNFRNEGVSTKHNPEFTMLEFYQAYADYADLMRLTETLLADLVASFKEDGQTFIVYLGTKIDMQPPFQKIKYRDALLKFNPELDTETLNSENLMRGHLEKKSIPVLPGWKLANLQNALFEKTVEKELILPTFVTEYPAAISPLARRNDRDPAIADRFELFIAGNEIANGFSELNDPEEQARVLRAQAEAKGQGDDEAMLYDEDYIMALEYGMPPTAGEGIGIDRLIMLLTDSASIRDVLLFPQLRPQPPSNPSKS